MFSEVCHLHRRSTSPHLRRRITVVRSRMMHVLAMTTHTRSQAPNTMQLTAAHARGSPVGCPPNPKLRWTTSTSASHCAALQDMPPAITTAYPCPQAPTTQLTAAHARRAGGKARQPAPRWNTSTMHRIVLVLRSDML
jgi:hypothetical protein